MICGLYSVLVCVRMFRSLDTLTWKWALLNVPATNLPSPRYSASMILLSSSLLIHGGTDVGGFGIVTTCRSYVLIGISSVVINPVTGSNGLCYIDPSNPCRTFTSAIAKYQMFNGMIQKFFVSSNFLLSQSNV